MGMTEAEKLAKRFHEAYEELAPSHGYETREASRKPWEDVPQQNKSLMIAVAQRLMDRAGEWDKTRMDFSRALIELRLGNKVSRKGWTKPGAYLVYQRAYPEGIAINRNTAEATGEPEGSMHAFQPYLMKCTASGSFVPWIPSMTDILAMDWQEGPGEGQEMADLREDRKWLNALEAAGVDNWPGIDEARRIMNGES